MSNSVHGVYVELSTKKDCQENVDARTSGKKLETGKCREGIRGKKSIGRRSADLDMVFPRRMLECAPPRHGSLCAWYVLMFGA